MSPPIPGSCLTAYMRAEHVARFLNYDGHKGIEDCSNKIYLEKSGYDLLGYFSGGLELKAILTSDFS